MIEDIITVSGIFDYMSPDLKDKNIRIELYDCIDSTNELIKKRALEDEEEGLVVVSNDQNFGRGRNHRKFFSSRGNGVYMSILLRPKMQPSMCRLITPASAVAAAEALNSVINDFESSGYEKSKRNVGIKWINDLFIGQKKVGGILAQSASCGDNIDYVVLGIGINVYEPLNGFPNDIRDIADSLFGDMKLRLGARNRIVASIINNCMKYYCNIADRSFIDKYKQLCIVLGEKVLVIPHFGERYYARVLDITSDGEILIQRCCDSKIEIFCDGEISIKLNC